MRLFVDEDVYADLSRLLLAAGHDLQSPISLSSRGLGDEMCLLHAATDRRTLITHNGRDFELLHKAWLTWAGQWSVRPQPVHSGIVIVPQLQLLDATTAAKRIDELFATEATLANSAFRIDRSGRWHRCSH